MAPVTTPEEVRFARAYVVESNDCWRWILFRDKDGYGWFRVGSHTDGSRRVVRAHRWAYARYVGELRDELTIDHLCRNHACVNPAHLEAVTARVNTQRGQRATATECPYGHPYSGNNLVIVKATGRRSCRACACKNRHNHGVRTKWSGQRAYKQRLKETLICGAR